MKKLQLLKSDIPACRISTAQKAGKTSNPLYDVPPERPAGRSSRSSGLAGDKKPCTSVSPARSLAMKISPAGLRLISFSEALTLWYDNIKKPQVRAARTLEVHQLYIKNLKSIIHCEKLGQMRYEDVLGYQLERQKMKACVSYINHETSLLAEMMKYADLWDVIARYFKPLPEKPWMPPRVPTPEEEKHFFTVALSDPRWIYTYHAVSLTNNIGAFGCELLGVQFKHVFLENRPPCVHIRIGKNDWRFRPLPLNEIAEVSLRFLVNRAKLMSRKQGFPDLLPDHYIFPVRISRGNWDVTKHGSRAFIRRAFREMRDAAGMPWLNPKTFRKLLLTKLLESGAPDETIESIAGWNSMKVKRFYSGRRMDAKFEALKAIIPNGKGGTK